MWKPTLKGAVDNVNKNIKMLNLFRNNLTNIYIYIYIERERERVMDKLPVEVIRKIYEYDSTFNIKFDKVLIQLTAHIFIYRCSECFK